MTRVSLTTVRGFVRYTDPISGMPQHDEDWLRRQKFWLHWGPPDRHHQIGRMIARALVALRPVHYRTHPQYLYRDKLRQGATGS